jgi:hypothetical protein
VADFEGPDQWQVREFVHKAVRLPSNLLTELHGRVMTGDLNRHAAVVQELVAASPATRDSARALRTLADRLLGELMRGLILAGMVTMGTLGCASNKAANEPGTRIRDTTMTAKGTTNPNDTLPRIRDSVPDSTRH